jgi:cytidyltransferase-like protein
MTYAYITGGGTKWIYDTLKNGGASKSFLGARVPYSKRDFDEILGGEPFDGKYVSIRTACQLSTAAYNHALSIKGDDVDLCDCIGLGVTAKLKTKGQRKGRVNSIIIAKTVCTNGFLNTYVKTYDLPSKFFTRKMQEILCARYINNVVISNEVYDNIYRMYTVRLMSDIQKTSDNIVMYSGSFNPLHESHKSVIEESKRIFPNHKFTLEITTDNFSKGKMGPYEANYRANCIDEELIFTNAKTFLDKANALIYFGWKDIIFPMGDDTYARITEDEKNQLLNLGVRFLVFLREKEELDNHSVIHPESYNLPKLKNISSTQIRKNEIQ